MNRRIILKDLNCPHCTGKIKNRVNSLDFVETVGFNTITKVLEVETRGDDSSLIEDVKK